MAHNKVNALGRQKVPLVTWHFDHSKGRTVKGINILNAIYNVEDVNIPVAFEIILNQYIIARFKLERLNLVVTKNDLLLQMLKTSQQNQLLYSYVLTDIWYARVKNLHEIKITFNQDFIMAMKSNRLVALSLEDKHQGHFIRIDSLNLEPNTTEQVYLKGLDFPVLLTKQIFTNKDGSEGILYLVCSDIELTYDRITALYQKRRNVEVFHKSIKSNILLAKSPTKTVRTQSNHVFASIYAAFKFETLKLKHYTNYFALKSKLYLKSFTGQFF
jgi:hypothetical protein